MHVSAKEDLVLKYIEDCIHIKEQLIKTRLESITQIADEIIRAYQKGNKIIWFGNGGSAADAHHLSAELVGKFYLKRKAMASIALTTNTSILTAVANDYDFSQIFARQVEALVNQGDIVIGISTSGDSLNVIQGTEQAKRMRAITVAFAGATGGELKSIADYLITVPSTETPQIQESHLMIGHIICYLVEKELFYGNNEQDHQEV